MVNEQKNDRSIIINGFQFQFVFADFLMGVNNQVFWVFVQYIVCVSKLSH
jgi:hypothetical protein